MQRRAFARRALALAGAPVALAALGGCGFQLRRPAQLRIRRLHLAGFAPLSAMADELRRQLRATPELRLVDAAPLAEVVLSALVDNREQVVAASTATGLVRELTLRTRLRFTVTTPQGLELVPETELLLSRDMSFSETAALAKEQEAQLLFRAMTGDIASQVLRRLAALEPATWAVQGTGADVRRSVTASEWAASAAPSPTPAASAPER